MELQSPIPRPCSGPPKDPKARAATQAATTPGATTPAGYKRKNTTASRLTVREPVLTVVTVKIAIATVILTVAIVKLTAPT